jgi:hypothetical protein
LGLPIRDFSRNQSLMTKIRYSGYRFPPEIIQQAIWLYVRFTLSFRDVGDLLAERGIMISYETVRRWVNYFGPKIAADLRKRRPKPHTTWHLDEVYLKIDGRLVYLWRAVDAEGEVLDVLVLVVNFIPLAQSRESGDAPSHGGYAKTYLVGGHQALQITSLS